MATIELNYRSAKKKAQPKSPNQYVMCPLTNQTCSKYCGWRSPLSDACSIPLIAKALWGLFDRGVKERTYP